MLQNQIPSTVSKAYRYNLRKLSHQQYLREIIHKEIIKSIKEAWLIAVMLKQQESPSMQTVNQISGWKKRFSEETKNAKLP